MQESPPPAATAAQKIPGPDEEPEGREREDENEENQAPSTSSGNGSGADQNARPRKKKSPLMEIKTTTTAFVQQEEVVDTMGTALDENVPLNLEDYSESLEVLREGGHLEVINS